MKFLTSVHLWAIQIAIHLRIHLCWTDIPFSAHIPLANELAEKTKYKSFLVCTKEQCTQDMCILRHSSLLNLIGISEHSQEYKEKLFVHKTDMLCSDMLKN